MGVLFIILIQNFFQKIYIISSFSFLQVVSDINVQTATFRDVLIHVGTSKDSPELREKIRAVRRKCVEDCKDTHRTLMPKIKR